MFYHVPGVFPIYFVQIIFLNFRRDVIDTTLTIKFIIWYWNGKGMNIFSIADSIFLNDLFIIKGLIFT